MLFKAAFIASTLLFTTAASAQNAPAVDHSKMDMSQPAGDQGPSSAAFAAANARMHTDMAITYTGDADIDFATGMIPHHQGAIDMARTVLEYGKDPELRKLAQDIVKAQESEIAFMKAWLAAHGK